MCVQLTSFDVFEDIHQGSAASGDKDAEANGFAGGLLLFGRVDILLEIKGFVDELVGFCIFFSCDVGDVALIEAAKQVAGLFEQRDDMLAFDFVITGQLFYKKLAVAENGEGFSVGFFGGLEGLDKGGVFSDVVGGVFQVEGFSKETISGVIIYYKSGGGRAWVSAASAIYKNGKVMLVLGQLIHP